MTSAQQGARVTRWGRGGLMRALLALALVAAATGTDAAIRFKRSGEATLGGADSLAGVPEACELDATRVWVSIDGRGDCIAFYATGPLERVPRAVLYFEGDITRSFRRDRERLGGHLETMRRSLNALAQSHKVPFVLVARPGTFGSTGSHADRRKLREYQIMREAAAAISRRYGIAELALSGQSGGATIVGALLALGLPSVICATPASGGYDLQAMLDWHSRQQGLGAAHREHPAAFADDMNVMDRIGNVPKDPHRRIFVIGDVGDRVTPFDQQRAFGEGLKGLGHHAVVIEANASGPDKHGLTLASLQAAGLCARGVSDADIRRAIGK